MSVSECADLQHSARANLVSQTEHPAEPNVLPPFSENLGVDAKLKLSNEDFNQTIYDFFKDQTLTPLSQLTATPPFPTPHMLAQFASKAYTDYEKQETDEQYERRLALPDGWKLLTTASNCSKTNGYFGAAYWHPEHQQVVIAHRGTDPKLLGALWTDLWTDLKGVLLNEYVRQMESASTFAHKIVEALRESRLKGVSFQLFFTGHSLGGWLAQVTTFTTEYLKTEGNSFLKSNNDQDCFHAHTVVFDSPGCKNMLLQMTDKLDVRLDGRFIDLEHLDITSYLSAPNRINTCNAHLGTVYRIFPDFSVMGWLEKHTAWYTGKTHSMQKIVDFFQRNEGNIDKDEQGKLKILEVIDWPISAGFRRGKEYKRFFKEAKHLNDYHPEVKNLTFQIKGYHPMRYQTKPYDERVSRLSVFCEQERQFLESYHWLRNLPEFFKPKELFSVMEGSQVQEQAVNILKGFEIKNDKIRCNDASALQALIPYAKRLLQLFPEIKENTNRVLSSDEIRNRVYLFETRHHIERVSQSPLKFNSDVSRFREFLESFREFLESEQQKVLQLQMVDGDEWTGLIKVHQVLQKIGCLSEGQYTVLKLERLLTVNQFMELSTLMQSTVTPHLLLIACEDNQQLDEETKDVIRTLFNTIKQKQNIKIIFVTRSGGSTVDFLQHLGKRLSGKGFVRSVEQLTWSDLTARSQEKLLEKLVEFQGAKFSLNDLMSAESPVANFLPLGDLLEENELKISDPVPISKGYNQSYYIERTFRHQNTIKQDIFSDKDVKQGKVILSSTKQEFIQLKAHNKGKSVHWLEKDETGKLVLQQSQGSLETVRRYIDTDSPHTYTADDLDKLLEQAQHQRVMLISDTAGMGKSTVLTHLSKRIKQKFPAKWVVRIALNDHTDTLKKLKQEQIDKEKSIKFVSEKLLKLKPGLEMELFKQCCEQNKKVRIVIMLDGFDEISPFYKETVIDLLQALRQTAVEQLWVTTRPNLREELEDKLQQLSYTLEPFSDKNQVEFLTKFWSLKEWFTEKEEKEETKKKLEIYAEHLLKQLNESISDKDRQFTSIPLLTRLVAEAFDKEVRTFYQSAESMPEISFELDLLGLYRRFVEIRYDIYQDEKLQVKISNVHAREQREYHLTDMIEDHQLLALKELFTGEQVTKIRNNRECTFSAAKLPRFGIVELRHDGKLHFIHRIFAEYFVADYLVNHLEEEKKSSEQVLAFILKDIFLKEEYQVIRNFTDGLFSRINLLQKKLQQYGKWIHDLGKGGVQILHRAAREGNVKIIGFLLNSVQAAEKPVTAKKLLLAVDDEGLTGWHHAVLRGNMEVLVKLWEWSESNRTLEELKGKWLLAKDNDGKTALQMAAYEGNLDILLKLWEWAEEKLTSEEINNTLLLATNKKGMTALHVAAFVGNLNIMLKVWEWAEKKLTTEEINNKLLLATDNEGRTVLQVAAFERNLGIMLKVWEWAEEKLTTEEINNKLLLATDNEGRTVLHVAAFEGNLGIMLKVWEWAEKKLTKEEINSKLLLATNNEGRTVLQVAAFEGNLDILLKVWEWAEEKLTKEEINNSLLLATDNKGMTALHVAAYKGNMDTMLKVWEWSKDKLTTEEINNKLLLATDNEGRTVLHVASNWGNVHILLKVVEWAEEKLTREEINKLLLVTNNEGRTVLHVASYWGNLDIMLKVLEWAEEKQTRKEINNTLLLFTDNEGMTALHVAAFVGKLDIMLKVWEWAEKKLTTVELNNKLLLATDNEGRTVLHVASFWGNLNMMLKVWEWAEENLTTEEINNKLLLATDNEARTLLHVAAFQENLNIMLKVWEWAEEKLTTEVINNNLLLATDNKGMMALHMAAYKGNLDTMLKIWEWSKEKLTTEEINNKLLSATDNEGRTFLQVAAYEQNLDKMLKLWKWLEKSNNRGNK